ncbi:ABC transporter permease [Georgenia thermotolerans]|uniref:Polyketide antibiotic transporter n=1 Tax=Georgenia thermotolerans TaxID=527326 RepID=A0A7J5URL2_9MICO|nr:polyketide antibiotic transporter [Georgenia thermotolerans]KAE8765092.1 polyketide antibiotic transporter [Georgenia thermotolerans]
MSATAVAPAVPRPAVTREPWAGTGTLLRLYLRLDRVRVAVWVLALTLTVAGTVPALQAAYPDAAARQTRAALMSNPSAVLMTGPAFGVDDYTFGAMVANELSLTVLVATSIMAVLLVVRHTRADEEAGRTEVLRALPVGRFAPATAALLFVTVATFGVGAGVAAGLLAGGLEAAGAAAMGLGAALTGLVFGAVAAVTTQVTAHARGASGLALAVLGAAFLVRGVGDIMETGGSWLSWFSPLAWAQQTRPFVALRWWPLALSLAAVLVLLAAAVALAQRRDLGAGLLPGRPGPAGARPALLSPAGLAARLLRGSFLGWAVGLFFFAVAFGTLARSLEDAVADLPQIGEWIGAGSLLADMTATFAAAMLSYLALGVAAFAVGAVLRLRAEEEAGRAALVLTAGASRARWLAGWLATVLAQSVALLVLSGLGLGLGVAAATGDGGAVGRLTAAALAYLPAVLATAGLAVALLGVAPRLASLAWAVVTYAIFVAWFGPLLGMAGWAQDISPVGLTPDVPVADAAVGPLVLLTGVAAVLVAAGFAGFRRRDLAG